LFSALAAGTCVPGSFWALALNETKDSSPHKANIRFTFLIICLLLFVDFAAKILFHHFCETITSDNLKKGIPALQTGRMLAGIPGN